jgi:hypothetical protein
MNSEERIYITIAHINDYGAESRIRPGREFILRKEPDNYYDDEAIGVYDKAGRKVGYVSNSTPTVARGTHSAGFIYQLFDDETKITVSFVTEEAAIALTTLRRVDID